MLDFFSSLKCSITSDAPIASQLRMQRIHSRWDEAPVAVDREARHTSQLRKRFPISLISTRRQRMGEREQRDAPAPNAYAPSSARTQPPLAH